MATVNLKLDEKLRNSFKAICSGKGSNMTAEIIKLIENEVAKVSALASRTSGVKQGGRGRLIRSMKI